MCKNSWMENKNKNKNNKNKNSKITIQFIMYFVHVNSYEPIYAQVCKKIITIIILMLLFYLQLNGILLKSSSPSSLFTDLLKYLLIRKTTVIWQWQKFLWNKNNKEKLLKRNHVEEEILRTRATNMCGHHIHFFIYFYYISYLWFRLIFHDIIYSFTICSQYDFHSKALAKTV